jgi:hypothetical protein
MTDLRMVLAANEPPLDEWPDAWERFLPDAWERFCGDCWPTHF